MTQKIGAVALAAAAAAAALTLSGAAPAQPAGERAAAATIVLVHGAFADGSGWRAVYDDLSARGYRVAIVQNPLTSLSDDVNATVRVIDRQPGPVLLVGHSWGGTVITEAGIHPKVVGLVYVSALAPDAGETTAQQYEGFPAASEFVIDTQADGFGFVNPERFKVGFAADADDADAAFLRDSQVPIDMSVFATRLENAAWRSRPSWAIIARDDRAFGAGMLLHMARRIGAEITEIPGSHAAFLTQPRAVADVIDRAARATARTAAPAAAAGRREQP
ncbi:alpha/beta fold hydrolase [Sphingosinicella terrae]|uniref:alpha/beta fold hydrolase n=1 Tax=Sphingosinicella terrae TaxID=2172047 RepID=UPI00254963D9|nr:alpha/beta hydrolase [Sphingosinicella terrae]